MRQTFQELSEEVSFPESVTGGHWLGFVYQIYDTNGRLAIVEASSTKPTILWAETGFLDLDEYDFTDDDVRAMREDEGEIFEELVELKQDYKIPSEEQLRYFIDLLNRIEKMYDKKLITRDEYRESIEQEIAKFRVKHGYFYHKVYFDWPSNVGDFMVANRPMIKEGY